MDLQTLHGKLKPPQRRELATKAGIAPRYLDQLATGFRSSPSLAVLQRLAAADSRLSLAQMVAEFAQRAAEAVKAVDELANRADIAAAFDKRAEGGD